MGTDRLTLTERELPDIEKRPIWLLLLSISALHSSDEDAGTVRYHTLDLLREDVDASLAAAEALTKQAEHDPLLRWSIVNTVAAIGDDAGVDFLHAIATSDYGELNAEACGEHRDTELLVAVMATEGLGEMARHSEAASRALADIFTRQREVAIREVAGRALLDSERLDDLDLSKSSAVELERVRSLRPVEAEDLVIDVEQIDVRQPKGAFARKPNHQNPISSPTVGPNTGAHNG